MKYYTARGNIHIHSNLSDGTSSIEEIAKDANKAGLDFIIIYDHEHLRGKELGLEGFYEDTLVLIGQEVNRIRNHYLVLGLNEVIENNEREPGKIVKEVKDKGGLGFIAHPFENGSPLVNNGATFPWTDFDIDGYDGMEISNYSSEWRDGAKTFLKALYANFINDLAFMKSPNPDSYAKWRELTKKKRVVGIIGSDAHAPIYKRGPFKIKILSYKYLFNSVNNYVYLESPLTKFKENHGAGGAGVNEAKNTLIKALKNGNLYISYDRIEEGDRLSIYLKNKDGNIFLPGDLVTPGKYEFSARFHDKNKNKKAKLKIETGDETVKTFDLPFNKELELNEGTYNISIIHPRHEKWIIANPIYVW